MSAFNSIESQCICFKMMKNYYKIEKEYYNITYNNPSDFIMKDIKFKSYPSIFDYF